MLYYLSSIASELISKVDVLRKNTGKGNFILSDREIELSYSYCVSVYGLALITLLLFLAHLCVFILACLSCFLLHFYFTFIFYAEPSVRFNNNNIQVSASKSESETMQRLNCQMFKGNKISLTRDDEFCRHVSIRQCSLQEDNNS